MSDLKIENYDGTPDENLRLAYKTIRDALAADLLDRARNATPRFFKALIVGLLAAMGYGGTAADAGRALGRSGNDGVDGVIDQDPLGSAKTSMRRWTPLNRITDRLRACCRKSTRAEISTPLTSEN